MKQFSKVKRVLLVVLVCWSSGALATNKPIPGIDIVIKKNPGGSIAFVQSDQSGNFSLRVKEQGNYTLSTVCKSGGCVPSQLQLNLPGAKQKIEADGSTSYEFTVGKNGLELRGQTLSIDLSKGAGSGGDLPGKKHNYKGVVTLVKGTAPNPSDVDNTPQNKYADDFTQVNTKLEARTANPTDSGDETPHNKYADDFTQINKEWVKNTDDPQKPGKKHNYVGTVTLIRGTAPRPDGSELPTANEPIPGVDFIVNLSGEQQGSAKVVAQGSAKSAGVATRQSEAVEHEFNKSRIGVANLPSKLSPSYLPDAPEFRTPSKFPPGSGPVSSTVKLQQPPPNLLREKETGGGDTTPHNKYADDFTQMNTKLDALAAQVAGVTTLTTDQAIKSQITALQTAIADLPTATSINALQISLNVINEKIDTLATTLTAVASAGTAPKAVVDGLKTDLTALRTDLTAFSAKVTTDNPAMKTQSTSLTKEDKKAASADNAVRKTSAGSDAPETPGGFGDGGPASPGTAPSFGGMGAVGMNPDMLPTGPVMSPVMTPPAGGAMGGFGGAGNPMMGPAGRH